MDKAYKIIHNRTIEQMIQASPGQSELNTLRARMTSIYQLRDLQYKKITITKDNS